MLICARPKYAREKGNMFFVFFFCVLQTPINQLFPQFLVGKAPAAIISSINPPVSVADSPGLKAFILQNQILQLYSVYTSTKIGKNVYSEVNQFFVVMFFKKETFQSILYLSNVSSSNSIKYFFLQKK